MPERSNTVRFQVPVTGEVAAAIERLADRMGRPSAWLSVELLEESLNDRQRFFDWMALGFVGKAYAVVKRLVGKRMSKAEREKEVRMQLNVPQELADRIAKVASQYQLSPVKFAGMLLTAGVHHHEAIIEAVTTKAMKRVRAATRGSRDAK